MIDPASPPPLEALTSRPQVNISPPPVPPGHTGTFNIEPEEHPDERKQRLHRELVLFWFCLVAVTATLLTCCYALFFTNISNDDKRSVFAVITLIMGGVVGYFLKK